MRHFIFLRATLICLICFNCSQKQGTPDTPITVDVANFEKHLQELLITADSGAIIELPEGRFNVTRSLSLDGIDGITIKGQGKHKTILSFKNQIQGAEGLLVKANRVTLEGFSIEDSKGDGLKLLNSRGVVLRDLNITWTNGADSTNGGYGIYPVACQKVLIENCEASYASDAGIYVGQSTDVVMRENYAHHNVAGIEIENSRNVECYNNKAENNTGGILVFNLPDLPQAFGFNVQVHDNLCLENNFKNFSPRGGMVNTLPPGAGMLVVAHRDLEIFDNEITGHKTLGLGIISYLFTRRPFDVKNGFEPFYYNVNVHDNVFERSDDIADQTTEFGQMISALFGGKPQDILIDGIFNPDTNTGSPICFQNNGEDIRFTNLNAGLAEGVEGMLQTMDHNLPAFECALPALSIEAL